MERIKRLEEIMQELGDIANSYAGEVTGTEATLLHLSCSNINRAINSINKTEKLDTWDVVKQYIKWSSDIEMLNRLRYVV